MSRDRDDEAIVGVHAVEEALKAGESLRRIVIGRDRQKDRRLKAIAELAKSRDVPVSYEADAAFGIVGAARHQHVAAFAPPFRYAEWSTVRALIRSARDAIVVVVDHIEDPQNLGAVLRNAEAVGAVAVVIPDRRNAAVTPAARRAAAGAASHVRVSRVPNLDRALADLKAEGCWVYGLDVSAAATPYTGVDFSGKCAIVVGAEGRGLSRLISERCDLVIRIPMLGKVASLNAACASAIVLYEIVRQRNAGELVPRRNKAKKPVNP